MAKAILTLLCCAMGAAGALAQTSTPSSTTAAHSQRVRQMINQQVQSQRNSSQQKTTTGGQQLFNAVTLMRYDTSINKYRLIDSLAYTWSNNRELAHYPNPIQIITEHEAEEYGNPVAPQVEYPPLRIQADSIIHYQKRLGINGPDTFLIGSYAFTFDAANHPIGKIAVLPGYSSYNNRDFHDAYTYDASGRMTSTIRYRDDDTLPTGLNLVEIASRYISYNSAGRIQQDSLSYDMGNEIFKFYYYQGAAGKDTSEMIYYLNQGAPVIINDITYTYDNSNRLSGRILDRYGMNGSYITTFTDSFAYSGSYAFPVFHQYIQTFTNSEIAKWQYYYTLNTAGDVAEETDTKIFISQTTTLDTLGHYTTYYNANGNPDSIIVDTMGYNGARANRFKVHLFRYEPTAVKDVAMQPVSVGLYPNPARQSITLSVPSFKWGIHGTASMYDMQGRLVITSGIIKNEQAIDVSRLPVGMYLVQYNGGNGSVGVARFVKE